MRIVTISQMKEIERRAAESGLSYPEMMENAGRAAADLIARNTKNFTEKITVVLVGKGNNGGDGYVAARRIKELGGHPIIIMAAGEPVTPDAKTNFNAAREQGIEIYEFNEKTDAPVIFGSDIIVDSVYGTGFHGELKSAIKRLFEIAADTDAVRYAIDIPSGINADDCSVADGAFKADFTLAIDSLKNAHVSDKTFEYCGRVVCADIGIPEKCHVDLDNI